MHYENCCSRRGLTSTSSVNRSSGTRRPPCSAMAATLMPSAVNSTVPTLQPQHAQRSSAWQAWHGVWMNMVINSMPQCSPRAREADKHWQRHLVRKKITMPLMIEMPMNFSRSLQAQQVQGVSSGSLQPEAVHGGRVAGAQGCTERLT